MNWLFKTFWRDGPLLPRTTRSIEFSVYQASFWTTSVLSVFSQRPEAVQSYSCASTSRTLGYFSRRITVWIAHHVHVTRSLPSLRKLICGHRISHCVNRPINHGLTRFDVSRDIYFPTFLAICRYISMLITRQRTLCRNTYAPRTKIVHWAVNVE